MDDSAIREGQPPYCSAQVLDAGSRHDSGETRTIVWCVCGVAVLVIAIVLAMPTTPDAEKEEIRPARAIGVMEKKFKGLRNEMTKAEVELALGEPTGGARYGGSKSTCEQCLYTWGGEDGTICVLYATLPNEQFAPWGPPGKDNRIHSMWFDR